MLPTHRLTVATAAPAVSLCTITPHMCLLKLQGAHIDYMVLHSPPCYMHGKCKTHQQATLHMFLSIWKLLLMLVTPLWEVAAW